MTLADRILELRIAIAWRRFERTAPTPDNIPRLLDLHAKACALQGRRRPEIVEELDRQRLERAANG